MSWQDDYLIKPIERQPFSWQIIKRFVVDWAILIPHALMPHKAPPQPVKELPDLPDPDERGFKDCEKIYDESLARIDTLEKKAFGLVSYVTALFAVFFFTYSQMADSSGSGWLFVPMSMLVLALVISFRCLSVKSVSQVFINDIYKFDGPTHGTIRFKLDKCYLNAAVFNQARGDNTADLLRAARMMLASSFVLFLLVLGAVSTFGKRTEKHIETQLMNDQVQAILKLDRSMDSIVAEFASAIRWTVALKIWNVAS